MPISPVAMPRNRAVVAVEHLRRGEARINLDAEFLRARGKPAARELPSEPMAQPVVVHQRRHHEIRQPERTSFCQHVKKKKKKRSSLAWRLERGGVVGVPVGNQPVETDGVDHRAGEDVGADFGAFSTTTTEMSGESCLSSDGARRLPGPRRRPPRRTPWIRGGGSLAGMALPSWAETIRSSH